MLVSPGIEKIRMTTFVCRPTPEKEETVTKKWIALLLLAAFVLTLAAGCAGTQAPAATQASAAAQAPEANTQTPAATEEPAAAAQAPAPAEAPEAAGNYPYSVVMTTNRALDAATYEDVYEKAPEHIICSGFQMLYILLDLGLQDRIVGMLSAPGTATKACYKSELIAAADSIPRLGKSSEVSKEELVALNCDFLMGWDSLFSDKNYDPDFCNQYGIHMYFPFCCYDAATFEDIYKDYEVLGRIFGVEELAAEKVAEMKEIIADVQARLAGTETITILNYDSGEEDVFTGCQGMPGNCFKLAGGISLFDDIQKGWAHVSWEEIVARNPETIVFNNYSTTQDEDESTTAFLLEQAALASTTAVKEGRIFGIHLDPMEGSADSALAVLELAKFLHPDKFE